MKQRLLSFCLFACCLPMMAQQQPNRQAQPETAPRHAVVHPGILTTTADIERMKADIKQQRQPAFASYEQLRSLPLAQADYRMNGPYEAIARDGEYRQTKTPMEQDFSAAWLNALMWTLTGKEAHARKAAEILTRYAATLRTIPDTNDAPLLVGLEGWKIAYAAEMLRYTYPRFDTAQQEAVNDMLRRVFLPIMELFYSRKAYTNGNWGPIVTKAYMALAILWDDEAMYRRATDFYLHARDNGTIAHYIDGETGQIQESGRDQGHCQLGIGALATVCEMAWKQGDDLYSALDNRLMKGYEYVAKYNLGYDVPFRQWTDITGKYSRWAVISDKGRGQWQPVFEIAYNHFVNRCGLEMPYTRQVLGKIRPEGYNRDQPGFGGLLFFDN
jgi:hypothetical protein